MKDEIEFLICDSTTLWRRLLNNHTKLLGISNIERRILINVERLPGATQIEIAGILEIEPQNLIRPLDKLVTENLIEKRPDSKDRRSNRLFITSTCQEILNKIHKISNKIRPIALAGLSEKEIQQFKKTLQQVKDNLESHLTV